MLKIVKTHSWGKALKLHAGQHIDFHPNSYVTICNTTFALPANKDEHGNLKWCLNCLRLLSNEPLTWS